MARENPVEDKHRRLVRSHRNGPLDRELKPNAKIRDDLSVSLLNFDKYHFSLLTSGNPQLSTESTPYPRGERSHLEIPFLSDKGQTWLD